MKHGADKVSSELVGDMNMCSLDRKHKMSRVNEFLFVMLKIRLKLLVKYFRLCFNLYLSLNFDDYHLHVPQNINQYSH